MNIINCRSIREDMLKEARDKALSTRDKLTLAIIQVEGDDASDIYVKNKIKTLRKVCIDVVVEKCDKDIDYYDLRSVILRKVFDPGVTGVMLQLPLPDHLKPYERDLLDCISWDKDVDGLSTASIGRLWSDLPCITPATPTGLLRLLPMDLSGINATVINRSNLIGKPLIKMLLDRDATVKVCHSKTSHVNSHFIGSDIVITGIGNPKYFYPVEGLGLNGRIIIDCGINRDEDGKLCGDVDIDKFKNTKDFITPVPGGVGILTTAQLALNVIKAYEFQRG